MRKINIRLENLPRNKDVLAAIGYLSTWAYEGYDEVTITPDFGNTDTMNFPDMVAYYKNTESNSQYVIGAIYSNNAYSFHS